jgi:Skp family chaperone for outer membrane proteins
MSQLKNAVLAALLFSLSGVSFAAKIGIIDMQKVILNVGEGKTERSKLERQAKAKGKKLEKLKGEVESIGKELQNKEKIALMSESALKKKAQSFQVKLRELQQGERKMLVDIKKQEAKATDKIAQKVSVLVERIAAKKGLDAVFETSNAGLMYAKDYIDLTSEIIGIYDKSKVKLAKKKK